MNHKHRHMIDLGSNFAFIAKIPTEMIFSFSLTSRSHRAEPSPPVNEQFTQPVIVYQPLAEGTILYDPPRVMLRLL